MTEADLPEQRRKGRQGRAARPLDQQKLADLALFYVSRFATTRAKLAGYLQRKLRERPWEGAAPPDVEAIVERLVAQRYVDDSAWAEAKARSMTRRGLGARRVRMTMAEAGVAEADREGGAAVLADGRVSAALRFAERKRLGPFATTALADPAARQKALAAFMRAGHDFALSQRVLSLPPGADPALLDDLD